MDTSIFATLVLASYVVFWIVSRYTSTWRTKRGKEINRMYLPDLLQDNFPSLHRYHKWIDWYIIVWMFIAFSYLFWGIGVDIVLKTLTFLLILFGLKEVFSVVTILPDSSKQCLTKNPKKVMGSCNSLCFSGHVASTLAVVYVLSLYVPKKIAIALYLQTVIYALLTVMSQNHYLIDVLVAFVVVDVVWLRIFLKYIL